MNYPNYGHERSLSKIQALSQEIGEISSEYKNIMDDLCSVVIWGRCYEKTYHINENEDTLVCQVLPTLDESKGSLLF